MAARGPGGYPPRVRRPYGRQEAEFEAQPESRSQALPAARGVARAARAWSPHARREAGRQAARGRPNGEAAGAFAPTPRAPGAAGALLVIPSAFSAESRGITRLFPETVIAPRL